MSFFAVLVVLAASWRFFLSSPIFKWHPVV